MGKYRRISVGFFPSLIAAPAVLAWFALGRIEPGRKLVIIASYLAVPVLFYLAMRLQGNSGNRFFHFVPVLAMLLVLDAPKRGAFRAASVIFIGVAALLMNFGGTNESFKNYAANLVSHKLGARTSGISLALTEAGWLALNSGAEVTDLWGLNTARFARAPANGAAMQAGEFDLIVLHARSVYTCDAMIAFHDRSRARKDALLDKVVPRYSWDQMIESVLSGIDPQTYRLYALRMLPGSNRRDLYFVKLAAPQTGVIEQILAEEDSVVCR